ncbi:MAG: hypothetical protein NQU46_01220 [Methanolinea sp.]|nr:hypothetical protein [Methanolinea sp.]
MTVCVVGLGYVGLPLAEAFARHLKVIGYRRNQEAVDELNRNMKQKFPALFVSSLTENSLIGMDVQNGLVEPPFLEKNAYEKAEPSEFMMLP